MLSQSAFNAFLKTLEEPPAYAKFILATTEKHRILPTILSRCQIFDFRRIGIEDISLQLARVAQSEGVNADPRALHIIAQKADGAMRDALSMFDQLVSFEGTELSYKTVIENLNVLDYDYYFRTVDALLEADISTVLNLIDEILGNGFDGQHFIIGLSEHFRNLLVSRDAATLRLLESGESLKEQYALQSGKSSVDFILNALEVANRCDLNYKNSNHKRLFLELSLLQMIPGNMVVKTAQESLPLTVKSAPAPVSPAAKASYQTPTKAPSPVKANETPQAKVSTPSSPAPSRPPLAGTISIKKALEQEPVKKDELLTEDDQTHMPISDFTPEELENAWKEFLEPLIGSNPVFANGLLKYMPEKDGFKAVYRVDNKILATHNETYNLLGFLKRKLNNYKITLEPRVLESDKGESVYTDREKYEKLAGKNQYLRDFKEKFNLEIEF